MKKAPLLQVLGLVAVTLFASGAFGQQSDSVPADGPSEELAMKLQNPIASLISMPVQSNFDFGGGPATNGFQYKANVQPVIPFSLSEDWNLISRTILPVISQTDVIGGTDQSGIGDVLQSVFISPQKPTECGWIWGAGPAMLFPTASDSLLGGEKWGLGPTAVVLRQVGGWTYGALANHVWSVAGDQDRTDISSTFLQPFLSYTTKKFTTITINSESTYDWEGRQWLAPINLNIAQLVKISGAPVQFSAGPRYYVEGPANGPEWGLRFSITLLLPG